MQFPNDENGDVLKRMYESGMDLTLSYNINFYHFFSDKNDAIAMYAEVEKHAGNVKIV